MPTLLVVGAGLFGSQAAAWARRHGIETMVFDCGKEGAASPAAAGLFQQAWAGRKLKPHFLRALPLLDRLYGLRHVSLMRDDGQLEQMLFVPPSAILEPTPIHKQVTAVGDGWLEAGGQRHDGWVYVAAGAWCDFFAPGLGVYGKAGSAFIFAGERAGRIHPFAPGRQALTFTRDAGSTYFSDGTAERDWTTEHDRQTLDRAAAIGLTSEPLRRIWGRRPWVPGGPVFRRLGERTWIATGGRKMGTILGASFARRLIEEELPCRSTISC